MKKKHSRWRVSQAMLNKWENSFESCSEKGMQTSRRSAECYVRATTVYGRISWRGELESSGENQVHMYLVEGKGLERCIAHTCLSATPQPSTCTVHIWTCTDVRLCAWRRCLCPGDCNTSLHCCCLFTQTGQHHSQGRLVLMSWLRQCMVSIVLLDELICHNIRTCTRGCKCFRSLTMQVVLGGIRYFNPVYDIRIIPRYAGI